MERKIKTEINAILIIGIVFSFMGAIFLLTGTIIYCQLDERDAIPFLLIFGGIGLLFLVIGLIFLIIEIRKKTWNTKLLRSGNYIMAEISEVRMNYAVNVNGRYPFIVVCRYQDMLGNVHMFKSRNLYFDPSGLFKDQNVKVYVDGEEFKHYYVDIDEILPNIIEH